MSAISESWTCPSCGARFTGAPPEHRLCADCLSQLESAGYEPAQELRTTTFRLVRIVAVRWWRSCR